MHAMKKALAILLLAAASCAHAPAAPLCAAEPASLLERADAYVRDGRYLEALTFYRDLAMNPAWAAAAGPTLYKSMAGLYRDYLGDTRQSALWYARYRAAAHGAPVEPAMDETLLSAAQPLPGHIRVLIAESAGPCRIASGGPLKITAGKRGFSSSALSCAAVGDGIVIDNAGPAHRLVNVTAGGGGTISFDGTACRGRLTVRAEKGRVLAICNVPVEEYLRGVLPREMSPSWPLEALKAQAVAARTYALYHALLRRSAAYDVLATTSSQVYDGSGATYPSVVRAVDQTRGQVLACGGRLALALFHANSGGRTEALEHIWGGRLACLCGVADPVSAGYPGAAWEAALPAGDIRAALARFGIAAGSIQDISAVERSPSGRVDKLKITGRRETFFLSGNSFRLIVGPGRVKGTRFEVRPSSGAFCFTGSGYGHGAGMSQWGACGMAKKGTTYEAILGHYYPGARIVQGRR